MIDKLSLLNFRNHSQVLFDTRAKMVLFSGRNGSGKTSILESISLLISGRGLRDALLGDITTHGASLGWQIEVICSKSDHQESQEHLKCTYLSSKNKKNMLQNGGAVKNSSAILDSLSVVWLTPQMQTMFVEAGGRRRFVDRMVYNIEREHADDVNNYNKCLSERLRLLKYNPNEDVWISGVENSLATLALYICIRRIALVDSVNDGIKNDPICPYLSLDGDVERFAANFFFVLKRVLEYSNDEMLRLMSKTAIGIVIENNKEVRSCYQETCRRIQQRFSLARRKDGMTGRTSFGPHKSDVVIKSSWDGKNAKECSTGEQKSFLVAITLSYIRKLATIVGAKKIIVLLLDDLLAYLDAQRQGDLLATVSALPIQTWISGINLDVCKGMFSSNVVHYDLDTYLDEVRSL